MGNPTQVALFALGFDPSDLQELAPEVLNGHNTEAVTSCEICEEEFITKMRLLLLRSDPIEEILTAFDYFNSGDSCGTKEISLIQLQKVAGEFNIRLTITELQEMIRFNIAISFLDFFCGTYDLNVFMDTVWTVLLIEIIREM
jgi:hypothetical protein